MIPPEVTMDAEREPSREALTVRLDLKNLPLMKALTEYFLASEKVVGANTEYLRADNQHAMRAAADIANRARVARNDARDRVLRLAFAP